MPYIVRQDDRCPASRPWGVSNQQTGDLHGCHPTKAHARSQQRALYAAEDAASPGRSAAVPEDDTGPERRWADGYDRESGRAH
jgi:hypothetical protein